MACLVLDTGLRIDECLHVEKRDVDLENFLLTVRHGKGDKERKVPLSLDGRNVLYRYLKLSKDSPYPLVFCTRNGTVLTHRNAERDLKRIGADIGVRLRWHLLRHTFGSLFIRNGGNVADLKRILGHASISTTMGYVHAQAEDFVAAHNGLSPLAKASRR
jgi:integrase/recombinase XerD